MNHYDPDTGIKIEPISNDVLDLFNRILAQNERILQLNERVLEVFGMPRSHYDSMSNKTKEDLLRHLK